MNRKPLVNGEYYHIFNRGVDKRKVFQTHKDLVRFLESMKMFNSVQPIGSLRDMIFNNELPSTPNEERLVEFICYCLNPNHYHFLLKQLCDGGISEFMKRLNGGYTSYFDKKYQRNGSLFEGRFKSNVVDSSEYLLHLSVYINLNNLVHNYGGSTAGIIRSSWNEYIDPDNSHALCNKEIILGQFENPAEYKKYALEILPDILEKKAEQKELKETLIE